MAKYRVLVKSFINNSIAEPGDVVEYDGKPGSNLELVEADKPKAGRKGRAADAAPVADPAPDQDAGDAGDLT